MGGDMRKELAAALDIEAKDAEVKPISEIQRLYNDYKKFLSGKTIKTPLPEEVVVRDENFPYLIKLEHLDGSGRWMGAKASWVIPALDNGDFDQAGYRHDPARGRALLQLPVLLRNPLCIHENMRHAERGRGGIQGRHVYVEYDRSNNYGRKVAFTTLNERTGEVVLVSSFWTYKAWVLDCAKPPALHVRHGCKCSCCDK